LSTVTNLLETSDDRNASIQQAVETEVVIPAATVIQRCNEVVEVMRIDVDVALLYR
jgi:hypothetical protein